MRLVGREHGFKICLDKVRGFHVRRRIRIDLALFLELFVTLFLFLVVFRIHALDETLMISDMHFSMADKAFVIVALMRFSQVRRVEFLAAERATYKTDKYGACDAIADTSHRRTFYDRKCKEEKGKAHRVWGYTLSVYRQDNVSLYTDVSDNFLHRNLC